uniref:Uncharacterized protein n=1 Tax=Anguilla anguilla TaxID=7936 RepID=A0A0E9VNR8_ANGAN
MKNCYDRLSFVLSGGCPDFACFLYTVPRN